MGITRLGEKNNLKARISTIAVVAAIGLAAGCGGGSSSTSSTSTQSFNSGFASATAQLQQTAAGIASAVTHAQNQTNSQVQSTFSGLADQWRSASSKLDSLNPPSAAATDFDTLKSASSSVEADLNAIAAAAGNGSASAARLATVKLLRDTLAAKAAAQKVQSES